MAKKVDKALGSMIRIRTGSSYAEPLDETKELIRRAKAHLTGAQKAIAELEILIIKYRP